jgi:hypothetical protein
MKEKRRNERNNDKHGCEGWDGISNINKMGHAGNEYRLPGTGRTFRTKNFLWLSVEL